MKTINLNQKHVRYRGAAIVEMAIVMSLLLMLTLGMVAFGYIFFRVQRVTYLARHGARVGCRYGADSATVTDALTPFIHPSNEAVTDIYIEGTDAGDEVRVTVQATDLDVMHLGSFLLRTGPLIDSYTTSVTMPKEGP
jgi:Flp pilus assembly protein TadG